MTAAVRYDAIVVGAGMGGLSAAAFLAREGKKVLVIEKHDKPGGYVTSFTRGGYTFNSSLAHLNELGEGQTIPQFVSYWGGALRSRRTPFKLRYFIDGREFSVDTTLLPGDLIRQFPAKAAEIERYFTLARKVMEEALRTGVPKPPFEMRLLDKLAFGLRVLRRAPITRRYGMKEHAGLLRKLIGDRTLEGILWGFYPVHSLNFLSNAWPWEKMRQVEFYYPEGGMQSIPDAAAETIVRNGGTMLLGTEVVRITVENNRAVGVECKDGTRFCADTIVANASVHHVAFSLCGHLSQFERLRAEATKRDVFISCFAIYMGVDGGYDFGGADYIIVVDTAALDIDERALTPDNCPIMLMVSPRPQGEDDYSAVVGAILPYEYKDCWLTGGTKKRGEGYYRLKEEVKGTIIARLCAAMGEGFGRAVKYAEAATPLTFERYTNNERGAIMGWQPSKKGFPSFIPFEAPVDNMYFVGHWTYPGGGVPTAAASGYYVAARILKKEGIDLEARMKAFTDQQITAPK